MTLACSNERTKLLETWQIDEPRVFRQEDWQREEVLFTLRVPIKWWMASRWPRLRLWLLMQRFPWRSILWTRKSASLP